MGELKGQLLGVLLVIILFGAIATTFATIVNNTKDKINEEYTSLISELDNPAP